MFSIPLHDELAQTRDRVEVKTRFGPVTGGRSKNGAVVFLGEDICCPLGNLAFDADAEPQKYLMLSHLNDSRIRIPYLQIFATSPETTSRRALVSSRWVPSTPILVD